jgi:hypothetical protein
MLSSLKAQDLISTTSNAKLEQRHNTLEHSALLVLPPSLCIGTHTHTHTHTLSYTSVDSSTHSRITGV